MRTSDARFGVRPEDPDHAPLDDVRAFRAAGVMEHPAGAADLTLAARLHTPAAALAQECQEIDRIVGLRRCRHGAIMCRAGRGG
jgi:hypothetical protein